MSFSPLNEARIAVIGLGYVGLPLAICLARHFNVIGFDISESRVTQLKSGLDVTGEASPEDLEKSTLELTTDAALLTKVDVFIVTVPTPIDVYRRPDLTAVCAASKMVGRHMKNGAIVVYESTVYPGLTEEVCVPILTESSGLKWREGFFVGYSPERINPGDREHTVEKITKVVAGDTPETLDYLAELYGSVIIAGVHRAESIKVAEAAKVIENTQRDLNIALMNELAVLFDRLEIPTDAVLRAAGSKWNFLPFQPGLVGGHCIGVDPYYLTHKAQEVGLHPDLILAGRRINDRMGAYIGQQIIHGLIQSGSMVKGARVLILGWTFKENVPDTRNTRVVDVYQHLTQFGVQPIVCDPLADPEEVMEEYGVEILSDLPPEGEFDGILAAVRHRHFCETLKLDALRARCSPERPSLIDVRGMFGRDEAKAAGFEYWRL
ncbi:nucleotide sugar dehydrogenase [Cerasicoccus arenae]|uniref:UDP-N-acetyl-D-galactosamine dehydrogenase n=1 Tax=Cerasicoccus arenae TaxID=424488 RepID=A0A8J3DB53_9BACT|nr:nucleotide sugar dehydrogenase [Cerasicoccus arenae]MBK1858659.1 nucleotide sugar dehydrogenase [Cerasicoccus arenae]GHC04749.1 UDP-N-acetyl-D-galactosamine dehydrogenase [Cerasicoccus arenae]